MSQSSTSDWRPAHISDLPQEFLPGGLPLPLGCRLYPMAGQHVRDRATTDLMPQIGQCSLDSPIPPTAVFFCQAHHQILDLPEFSRSAASSFSAAIVFLRDQPSMPGQQGLGRNNRSPSLGEACFPIPWPWRPIGGAGNRGSVIAFGPTVRAELGSLPGGSR